MSRELLAPTPLCMQGADLRSEMVSINNTLPDDLGAVVELNSVLGLLRGMHHSFLIEKRVTWCGDEVHGMLLVR